MVFVCKNCGNRSIDGITKENRCPECDCHILKNYDISETVFRPDQCPNLNFDAEQVTKELIELVMPAIIDESKIEEVVKKLDEYFDTNYSDILTRSPFITGSTNENYRALTFPLEYMLSKEIKARNYAGNIRAKELISALNSYDSRMAAPVQGLGFSIITNDFISAATYTALAAHNYKKQISKREFAAHSELLSALSKISTPDKRMSEGTMFELFDAISETVTQFDLYIKTYNFIASHIDFYTDEERYNLHQTIDGTDIYRFLAATISKTGFYKREDYKLSDKQKLAEKKLLADLEARGYIYRIRWFYFTTAKFEKETLLAMYLKEHPEEKERLERQKAEKEKKLYTEAERLLKNEQYYDAAVTFSEISGYQDAATRSLDIWHKYIDITNNIGFFTDGDKCIAGIADNGTVSFIGKTGELQKSNQILNAYKGAFYDRKLHILDMNGKIILLQDPAEIDSSTKSNNTLVDCAKWNYSVDIASYNAGGDYGCLLGLCSDGRVFVYGENRNGNCNVLDWRDIVKIKADLGVSIGIKSDGSVLLAGDENVLKLPYDSWRDVVDVFVSNYYLIALKKDGTLLAAALEDGQPDSVKKMELWENIIDVRIYDDTVIGITSNGSVYFTTDSAYDKDLGMEAFFKLQKNVVDVQYNIGSYEGVTLLHTDGTVTAKNIPFDLSDWNDIVSVGGNRSCIYGIKRNGTLVFAAREEKYVELLQKAENLKLFDDINTIQRNKGEILKERVRAQRAKATQKLDELCRELEQTKGLFSLKRKSELKAQIDKLERELNRI